MLRLRATLREKDLHRDIQCLQGKRHQQATNQLQPIDECFVALLLAYLTCAWMAMRHICRLAISDRLPLVNAERCWFLLFRHGRNKCSMRPRYSTLVKRIIKKDTPSRRNWPKMTLQQTRCQETLTTHGCHLTPRREGAFNYYHLESCSSTCHQKKLFHASWHTCIPFAQAGGSD